MKEIIVGKYCIRLMDHNNLEEVRKVQELRYQYLLKDYNPNLADSGIDDDGYDDYSESILVIDTQNDIIAGTYRVATKATVKNRKFLTEDEYDISFIKASGEAFLELGRAVVRPEYRNGFVIELLFKAIHNYASENNIRYLLGLCSFHGHDPSIYKNGLAYLKQKYVCSRFDIKAVANPFSYDYLREDEYDLDKAKKELPNLLNMYLKLGHKVSMNGSIDYKFNSCDVLVILDINEIDIRFAKRLLAIGKDL